MNFSRAEYFDNTYNLEGTYEVISALNNRIVWEIAENGKSQVWNKEDSILQKFSFKYDEVSNSYFIISEYTNTKVGVGTNDKIMLFDLNSEDDNVKWIISGNSNNGYVFRSKVNNKVLDIVGADTRKGTEIRTFNYNGTNAQKFKLIKIENIVPNKTIDNGEYQIVLAANTRQVVEVTGANKENGGNIEIWENNKTVNQIFNVTYLDNGYYRIEGKYSQKAFDVQNDNKRIFANVQQYSFENNNNQQWIIKSVGNGYYNIISKSNGLFVEAAGGGTWNGNNIRLYSGNGTIAQKFKFEKIQEIEHKSVLEDGEYQILSVLNKNNAISIQNGSTSNTANCQLNTNKKYDYQVFEISNSGDGYYIIKNKHSGKVLEAMGGGIFRWTNVSQYVSNGTEAQKWIIKDYGNGVYGIISKINELYMEAAGGGIANGTNVQLYNGNDTKAQRFFIKKYSFEIPEKTIEDGLYQIESALGTNLVLDVDGAKTTNGANVQLWKNNNVPQQKFQIERLSNGYYIIKASHSGKVLDLQDRNMNNFGNIQQLQKNDGEEQQWLIEDAGDGYYYIISRLSEKYIDVAGGGTSLGTNIRVYTGNGTLAQKFKFKETKALKEVSYKIGIKNNSSRVLDVDNCSFESGANIHIWDKAKHKQQIFSVKYIDNNYFTLNVDYNGKVLAIDSSGNLSQTTYTGDENQIWSVEIADDGNYFLKLKANSKYLTIVNSNNGAGLGLEEKILNSDRQMFNFNSIATGIIGTYGKSGLNYKNGGNNNLNYYEFGCGENVLFATFAVHGFEDNWYRDGEELKIIADDFYAKLINSTDSYIAANWTVYIFPTVNPDGVYYGTTQNGPGRTTLYSKAPNNTGIDINRSWQVGDSYKIFTDSRNYNGTTGFQAYEAEALRNFMLNHKSTTGRTLLVDLHGWEGSLIGSTEILANYYKPQFTDSVEKYESYGTQYVISWGRAVLGAESALVELPYYIKSHQDALNYRISEKYITATINMLKNISLNNKVSVSKKMMATKNNQLTINSVLENNYSNNYYIAIAGMEKGEIPNNDDASNVKEKYKNKKGLYVVHESQQKFIEMINQICNNEYELDEDGCVSLKTENEFNKYDKFIVECIYSEQLFIFNISGELYMIDPASNEVISDQYESLDGKQTYNYAKLNGNFAIDIPKNSKNMMSNEEIFDSIVKMIEIESER